METAISWKPYVRGEVEPPDGSVVVVTIQPLGGRIPKTLIAYYENTRWYDLEGNYIPAKITHWSDSVVPANAERQMEFTSGFVAYALGITPRALRYWIADGKIPNRQNPRNMRRYFTLETINKFRLERNLAPFTASEAVEEWEKWLDGRKNLPAGARDGWESYLKKREDQFLQEYTGTSE